MGLPGFTAHLSLYTTKIHYRMTGALALAEVDAGIILAGDASSTCRTHVGTWAYDAVAHYGEAYETGANRAVLPMGEPGHVSAPGFSSQCNECTTLCQIGANAGFDSAVVGCLALAWIPWIGGFAYAACVATAAAVAYVAERTCESNCSNVGSPCCPQPCGPEPFCCFEGELCLDSGLGLCCSAGTRPCPGPQESCCFTNEVCLPTGACCIAGQDCGDNCCDLTETCVDGTCINCPAGSLLCGNQCCDLSTHQCIDNACCPIAQACGGTCCPVGTICNASGQCVAAQACLPGEFLCVSGDKTTQTCCAGDQTCCNDGSCCGGASNPGYTCCESRGGGGCIPAELCFIE